MSWEHVLWMKRLWEPWDEPHLVVDSARCSPEEASTTVLSGLE
ncbi:hypothetical protein [Actinosynnema sp. NPDC020468]